MALDHDARSVRSFGGKECQRVLSCLKKVLTGRCQESLVVHRSGTPAKSAAQLRMQERHLNSLELCFDIFILQSRFNLMQPKALEANLNGLLGKLTVLRCVLDQDLGLEANYLGKFDPGVSACCNTPTGSKRE